jgi:dihydrofolate reductase
MRKLSAFMQVTLDGYFASPDGGLDWAHRSAGDAADFKAFVADNAKGGGALLFGRRTYEMMASYWPTPLAREHDPVVAEHMNRMPKLVASRTLERLGWENAELLRGDLVKRVQALKSEPGGGITILGSASLVTALSDARLIDEYQLVLSPVALGAGQTLFRGLERPLELTLEKTRTFSNGSVFLSYAAAG